MFHVFKPLEERWKTLGKNMGIWKPNQTFRDENVPWIELMAD